MSGNRLGTANSASSSNQSRPYTDPINEILNDASELTIGPTIYGNPLRGLMARKKGKPQTAEHESSSTSSLENKINKNQKSKDSKAKKEDESELYKELKTWRTEHER